MTGTDTDSAAGGPRATISSTRTLPTMAGYLSTATPGLFWSWIAILGLSVHTAAAADGAVEPSVLAAAQVSESLDASPFELDAEPEQAFDLPSVPAEFASFEFAADAPDAAARAQAAALKKKKADLKKAVAGAYKPLFYDNNFSYIHNPLYNQCFFGDCLKDRSLGGCWEYDLGGQFRMRHHSERHMRGLGLTGLNDDFLLYRTRLFANVRYGEDLRFYGEFIDAVSNYERFNARGIEENRTDFLNLFADVRLLETCRGSLTVRGGRQELLYGSERLISPLDWANTRRTFEGGKVMWAGENWNVDFFYVRPVLPNAHQFDSPDYRQEFGGVWSTYKGIENQTIDIYWLSYWNSLGATGGVPNNYSYQTNGMRWLGAKDAWLWELEGGVQYGTNSNGSDHSAGFATAGLGHKWEQRCWKPVLWGYYDWASGANGRGQGQGFNHLFPLGHKYLGFMDLFGRSNIQSPNLQLVMQPHEKLKVLMWYYYLFLSDADDTPYSVVMTPFNARNTPASRDLGHEIDLLFTYTLNPRMDLMFGYSHFFSGEYYKQTPGLTYRGDADFFYTQYQWNF